MLQIIEYKLITYNEVFTVLTKTFIRPIDYVEDSINVGNIYNITSMFSTEVSYGYGKGYGKGYEYSYDYGAPTTPTYTPVPTPTPTPVPTAVTSSTPLHTYTPPPTPTPVTSIPTATPTLVPTAQPDGCLNYVALGASPRLRFTHISARSAGSFTTLFRQRR